MSKKSLLVLSLILAFALLLSACGGAQPTAEEPVAEEPVVEAPAVEEEAESPAEEPVVEAPAVEEEAESPAEEPVVEELTLTILHSMSPDEAKSAIFDEIVADFMAVNPNIKVEVEVVPDTDIVVKAETAFVGGVEQDLIFHNYPHLSDNWIYDGMTVALNDYLSEWGLDENFYQIAIDEYTNKDGQLAALPMEGFTWPIWYNTAILDEVGVGVPATVDEMLAAAEKIRTAGYQPFVTGGSDWTGARMFGLMLSAYMTPAEFEGLLMNGGYADSPNAVKAAEDFVAMRDSSVFADDVEGLEYSSMQEMFFAGEAAMIHHGSWAFGDLPAEMVEQVVLGGFPLPEGSPHGAPVMFGGFGAKGIHVTRNGAENLAAVQAFVQYFFQPDVFVRFVNETGLVAPIKDLPVDETMVPPLFAASLSLPEVAEFGGNPDLVPGDIGDPWIAVINDGFIPDGMTAAEILAALDALYE